MPKLLIIDDDKTMLGIYRMRLADTYQIIDTSEPEEALALALEHKPDVILLDLVMPQVSGFGLCQNLHSLSYTAAIPIFIVTGEAEFKYREQCGKLGAKGYFEKPIDFSVLKAALEKEVQKKQPERRSHVRVRMKIALNLRGTDATGKQFEESTATEDVSASGFLCPSNTSLIKGTTVEVLLPGEHYVGLARVVRRESPGAPWQKYGFCFVERTGEWIF
jgi:response regulator RpfG family c-di-GMP phosphodiesterase